MSSAEGMYGFQVPKDTGNRVQKGQAFLWPLMSILWAFNPEIVAQRSLISKWIINAKTIDDLYQLLHNGREQLKKIGKIRLVENLPSHEDMTGL